MTSDLPRPVEADEPGSSRGAEGSGDAAPGSQGDGADGAGSLWHVEGSAGRGSIAPDEVDRASRAYWEAEADTYQAEHGAFLAGRRPTHAPARTPAGPGSPPPPPLRAPPAPCVTDSVHETDRVHDTTVDGGEVEGVVGGFVWGPEGLNEAEARLLGAPEDLTGLRVLEVGCGAAQCSQWLATQGALAVGVDISVNQLRHALRAQGRAIRGAEGDPSAPPAGGDVRGAPSGAGEAPADAHVVAGSATALPFGDRTFDHAFASYGAVQFVAALPTLLAEVARVLRPGGRWVFSVTHPIRWAFPDDPGPAGLTASGSYFDRTPYVERDGSGHAVYAEFHRTLGDYVAVVRAAGFAIEAVVEPEWPDWNAAEWGGWSPLRGTHLPGTLIIGCRAGGGTG